MKILISGAGLTGNSLAFWLSKLGHHVTVVERATRLRMQGLQVDLRGQGIEVIKRMGLEEDVRQVAPPEQGLRVVDRKGKERGYFLIRKDRAGVQNFTSEYEIMRGDLCQLLYKAALEHNTQFIFGQTIEQYEQKDNKVYVRFRNGAADVFDMLIGADGQWSQTRRMMLGVDQPDKLFFIPDTYIAYYTIPLPIEKGEKYVATLYLAGGKGVMTRRHAPDKLQIYIGGKSNSDGLKNVRRGDVQNEKAALKSMLQGSGWKTDTFLSYLDAAEDFYCERIGVVKMDSWSKDRVVLVGDAAYCPSVNTGMGTTSGIVGAYILAGEIGKHCKDDTTDSIPAALKSYEEIFRPFMQAVQKGVLEDPVPLPDGKFGIAIFNILIGVASFLAINIAKWMMKEDVVKSWILPSYEELI